MPFTRGITVLKNRVNVELLFVTVPISQKMEYYRMPLAMRPLMACHTVSSGSMSPCALFSYFELCKSLCLLPHGVCVLMVTALRKHPRDSGWRCHKSFKEECKAECQDKDLQGTGWGNSKSQSVGSAGTPLTDKHERKRSKLNSSSRECIGDRSQLQGIWRK